MSESTEHDDKAMLKGIGAGLVVTTGIGLVAGFLAATALWPWPAELGEGFAYFWNSTLVVLTGVAIGGAIGLVVGTALAWHGGIIGSTLDRGDAAPIFGVLTGIVMGGSFGPVLGAVFGLAIGQLAGGAIFGLVLGPIVGIIGWESAYWMADFSRGSHHAH
jgi:hypothetical protein